MDISDETTAELNYVHNVNNNQYIDVCNVYVYSIYDRKKHIPNNYYIYYNL